MKHIKLLLIIIPFLICGCTTLTIVDDWQKVPANSIIDVHTKHGTMYQLYSWKMNKDSSLLGSIEVNSNTSAIITIEADSIAVVYFHDSQPKRIMETSITIAGSLLIGAAIVGIIFVLIHSPFAIGGGR